MPQSSMAQSICDPATLKYIGRGGGLRCGTFGGGLASPPQPVQLGSGMEARMGNGEWLARQGLMGSHQEFGLYPEALGRLSAGQGEGWRKDPCCRGFENGGAPLWPPGCSVMTGDLGGRLSRTW